MPSELYINKEEYKQTNASSQVMNSLFSFMVSMGINIALEDLQKQAFTTKASDGFFAKNFGILKNFAYLNKQQPNDVFKQIPDLYNKFTWKGKQNLFSVFGDENWNTGTENMKEFNKLFKEHLKRESKEKTVTDGVKQVTNGVKQATDGVKQSKKKAITNGVKQATDGVEQVNNSVKRALFMYKTYSFLNFVSSASSAESAIDLGYNLVKGIVLDPLQERGRRVEEKENKYAFRMSKYKESAQYIYQDSEQNQMYRKYQQQKIQEYYSQAVSQTAIDRIENPYIIYRMM